MTDHSADQSLPGAAPQAEPKTIEAVRGEAVNAVLIAIMVLSVPAVAASLFRATEVGWRNVMILQIGAVIALIVVVAVRRRLGYRVRVYFLIVVSFLIWVVGLVTWGLIGLGLVGMFATSILATVFLGTWIGLWVLLVTLLSTAAIGAAVVFRLIAFDFDVELYAISPGSWITAIAAYGLIAGAASVLVGRSNTALISFVGELEQLNAALHGKNAALEREIAERKNAEAQLAQAQKMEAVGQLTGGVAHEFNNLLTVVLGNLELLEDRVAKDPAAGKLIGTAVGASERGAELTQQLLTFARRQMLDPRSTDINQLVSRMAPRIARLVGESIAVKTVLADDLRPASTDRGQLEHVLVHLVANARDGMPDGGALVIETADIVLDRDDLAADPDVAPGRYVTIAVGDTGTGMPPDVLARVFEPFYTTKDVGRGSGLGLSMAYGFAKQSAGHLAIDSEVGAGTLVTLYLPCATAADGETSA